MAVNKTQIQNDITKQVQNDINRQKQAINGGLASQKQQFDSTINQNKAYLTEQVKGYKTQNLVNGNNIQTLQNRRGGFYSGGLDYQLAENDRNTANQTSGLTRDINSKNQSISGQYNTLASQAANQISLLQQQAPDKIRELVNAELDRQNALSMEQEKWNLQKQQMQLELEKARKSMALMGSGGGSGGSSRRSSSSSRKASTTNPSAVPANAREFAQSNIKWFTPAKGKENLTYNLHGITRESPVYGNYNPQPITKPKTTSKSKTTSKPKTTARPIAY